MKTWLIIGAVVAVAIGIAYCFSSGPCSQNSSAPNLTPSGTAPTTGAAIGNALSSAAQTVGSWFSSLYGASNNGN